MIAPVAVFGIGNRSRGDDAVGPLLLDRLRAWLGARGRDRQFELFEAYQLQVENALDLEGRRLALFIDARLGSPSAVDFRRLEPPVTPVSCLTHSLEPAAILQVQRQVGEGAPPPAYALGVSAVSFELGEGLSENSRRAAEKAWGLLESLAGDPQAAAWEALATRHRKTGGETHGNSQDPGDGRRKEGQGARSTERGREAPDRGAEG